MKKAFLTGITGQDGSYLAEFLLHKGYEVHGLIRRSSTFNTERIDHLYHDFHDPEARLFLHYGDLSVSAQLMDLLHSVKPDEIYNLGAQSHVRVSFDMPEYTGDVTALGTLRILEAIRKTGITTKFYQASSSEMFGAAPPPQHEKTVFQPRSPYAAAKVYSYYITQNYRDAYGIFAANGILFNHESPRRGETFVTRKITRAATQIKLGLKDKLYLGNLEAKRDWGFAGDYVEAMWLMLQQNTPDDFVIATGETHSVREFAEMVFQKLDLDYKRYVEIDKRYFRPTEVDALLGDSTKAKKILNWQPRVSFENLVDMMIASDMELAQKEKTLLDAGFVSNNQNFNH
ncbi:MAG TPA: GDP-mannose 4,6-dehydratase [Smithella sp.]|jgi:GDPmannose 4,6-dehydratase|nr:GDP-mannose 4,6-dehydratase [Smithella sp.]NMC97605.1 GDP-mannose 4,6-dehydratase [Deltaproteobacteria bacterium]HOE32206.1 GDP-mannose 4,6-dehydratase [Smithella sp.]HOG10065.1 GDP-mannose 4,6-dehydratase [Smithella sp.]HOO34937.1 GDP-mannose 4,6-dehydratase [Smithella sp.]